MTPLKLIITLCQKMSQNCQNLSHWEKIVSKIYITEKGTVFKGIYKIRLGREKHIEHMNKHSKEDTKIGNKLEYKKYKKTLNSISHQDNANYKQNKVQFYPNHTIGIFSQT